MPITRRSPFPHKGYIGRKGAVRFSHEMLIGAGGAITSQDLQKDSGIVAAKQGTAGQYLLTLPGPYRKVLDFGVTFQTAVTVATGGFAFDFESNNIDRGTTAGTILLQFRRPDTMAAADVANPTTLTINIEVMEGV